MYKLMVSFSIMILLGVYGLYKLNFHPFVSSNKKSYVSIIYDETVHEIEIERYTTLGEVIADIKLGEDVDTHQMNASQILKNGDKYIVPLKRAVPCISINTADVDLLTQLVGVGPSIAQRIISYRNENGLFHNIEDIMNIKGIGEKTFEKMRDQLCI